jgi:phosphopantetheine--protein transferase-like protein
MIEGLGIDTTEISRHFEKHKNNPGHIFSIKEIEKLETLSSWKRAAFAARCWATKEALYKATSHRWKIPFNQITYVSNGKKPYIELQNNELEFFDIHISLTEENNCVTAIVIVENRF